MKHRTAVLLLPLGKLRPNSTPRPPCSPEPKRPKGHVPAATGRLGFLLALLWAQLGVNPSCPAIEAAVPETPPSWPHLRGPSYRGEAIGPAIALPWPASGPPLLWKLAIGQGYSGFIAVEDKVYTQVQTRAGQQAVCLDLERGRVLWRARLGFPWELGGRHPGPYATPTYAGGRLYVADCYGALACLNAATGALKWRANLTERFSGEGTEFGYACTPLLEGGLVFMPVGGLGASVVALQAENGAVAWRSGDDVASYASCLSIEVEGHRQVVSFLRNALVAHDPQTGSELWRDAWPEGYAEHSSWPLYQEPLLFCAVPFRGGARVLRLSYQDGKPKAERVWQNKELSNDVLSSALKDGFVYGFDVQSAQAAPSGTTRGEFKCLELATGKVRWSTRAVGHASVLPHGDRLLLWEDDGELVLAGANPAGFEEVARATLLPGELTWTPPLLYRGRLLVRNRSVIACFQLESTPAQLPPPMSAAPAPPGRLGMLGTWLDRYQDNSFWAPSPAVLARWYAASLVAGGVAAALAFLLKGPVSFLRAFALLAGVLGILATPALTWALGRFTLTWTLTLFLAYVWAVSLGVRADPRHGQVASGKARLGLGLFVALCVAHFLVCRSCFLVSGWGLLVGFLPALPFTILLAHLSARRAPLSRVLLAGALSFSVYYGSSAVFTWWRTN